MCNCTAVLLSCSHEPPLSIYARHQISSILTPTSKPENSSSDPSFLTCSHFGSPQERKTSTSNLTASKDMLTHTPIHLGVAAERRKLHSAPMQAILLSLQRANPSFRIVHLDEHYMYHQPVHSWPLMHALLTLYSPAFPLDKVLEYVALRRPVLVNNLHRQRYMMDRRKIRAVLAKASVPTPRAVCVDRTQGDHLVQTGSQGDSLVVHSALSGASCTIRKPFVEKPVDPEDHNVYIYYKGGGIRKLFRKTKHESSHFVPNETQVRQTGSYIYEKFYEPEERADVKVYAVGDYFYAEARKAPHIDGIVDRDQRGLERRVQVILTEHELEICRKAAAAFDQFVLGFDLLRGPGKARFVIDVNGWSLVKNSDEYAMQCGKLLAEHIVSVVRARESCFIEETNSHGKAPRDSNMTSLLQPSTAQSSTGQKNSDLFDPAPGSPCVA